MKIYLVGYIASGKRKWAKRIRDNYNLNCIDTRELMSEISGKEYAELLTDKESYIKYEQKAFEQVLKTKDTVVVCSELLPCRNDNMEVLKKDGLSIYMRAGLGCIMMKLPKRKHKIPLINGIDSDILPDFIKMELSNRKPYYLKAHENLLERELKKEQLFNIINKHFEK